MATKVKKPTKSEMLQQEIRLTVKGREGKQALDEFIEAVNKLVSFFGKRDAMQLFVKVGMLITFAKEEGPK